MDTKNGNVRFLTPSHFLFVVFHSAEEEIEVGRGGGERGGIHPPPLVAAPLRVIAAEKKRQVENGFYTCREEQKQSRAEQSKKK